jgi:Tar ligand binding domain homologue
MFQKSIRQKIIGVAAGLIILAVITSVLSIALTSRVAHLLDEVTNKYIPAYGDLARVNIRSLERSLALQRMIIAKMQSPPDIRKAHQLPEAKAASRRLGRFMAFGAQINRAASCS